MPSAQDNVGGWIVDHAERSPDHAALVDGSRRFTYEALEGLVARAAGWLREAGVERGDRVALLLWNRAEYLALVFAAARLGAIAVPLNARLAPPEIAQLLDDCRPRVLVHEDELGETVARALAAAGNAVPVVATARETEAALEAASPRSEIATVSTDDPMILMYTSGTTGRPKGALLPHRKTLYNSRNAERFFGTTPADRVLTVVPLFHSFGLKILAIPALYAGACVVLERHFDAERFWARAAREHITYLGGVPTMFRALLDVLEARPETAALPDLRFLFTAGAAIPVDVIRGFEAHGLVLKQGFGQTETSILCCLDAQDAIRKAGSVGRPVHHGELRIVRATTIDGPVESWEDCDPDEIGEIVVRGPITMLGYWERPEATAETIREGGWLRTGDLASADGEGFVTLTGRARDLFISGGENVYPAQVEAVYQEHPDVREIAVVGVADERWGEVGRAYVVAEGGAALDADALRSWGRERLATFKVPRDFVTRESLPRTASGKVQKFALE